MTEEGFKRKLTAILSADVEGYSRLMGEDEDATIRTLTTYRELMSTLIQKHRGRVVDSPGDNLLAEFGSVVDAVRCAVEIQEELRVRNAELPEDRKMQFRIGVNLGDVVEEGERIYGDGVNIAARVEGLAEGGGICISGAVHDSIKNKLSLSYESLGEHTVKNISEPVRVYRMRVGPEVATRKKAGPKRWRRAAMAGVAALILVIAAVAIWNFYLRRPSVEAADPKRMAFPLPEKPSIAVLPFVNMSEDPKQEYFSDGLTEEIISALAKVPKLFVIARNSTFTYKGKPVKVQQVSEELGVRYVLEGSVRKAGDRVRVTAQLIDATTGHHLWSERYDRELKDIFALQDEITMKIITSLRVKLTEGEQARVYGKGTENLEAYLKFLEGQMHALRLNKEDNALARRLAEETIALDPDYEMAYVLMAKVYLIDIWLGSTKSPRQSLKLAFENAQKALALNDSLAYPHSVLGHVYALRREHEKAVAQCEEAIALEPNSAESHAYLALTLVWAGEIQKGFQTIQKAIRLNPFPPSWHFQIIGATNILLGHYEEAIVWLKKALHVEPQNLLSHIFLTAAYIVSGHEEEAKAEAEEVLRINPKFSLIYLSKTLPYKKEAQKEIIINALRKAGLK